MKDTTPPASANKGLRTIPATPWGIKDTPGAVLIVDLHGAPVARVYGFKDKAPLLAAAPALLEACKGMHSALSDMGCHNGAMDLWAETIAKAESLPLAA